MHKKYIICMLCVMMISFINICSAEKYKNEKYNFQMEFPAGWGVHEKTGVINLYAMNNSDKDNMALLSLGIINKNIESINSLSKEDRIQMISEVMKNKYAKIQILNSGVQYLGQNEFTFVKFVLPREENINIRFMCFVTFINEAEYFFILSEVSKKDYTNEIFDALSTLEPIRG